MTSMTNRPAPFPQPPEPTPRRVRLWSAEEVATFLGMTAHWVRGAASRDRIPFLRLPGTRVLRFDPTAVRAWAAGHGHRLALAGSASALGASSEPADQNPRTTLSVSPATVVAPPVNNEGGA
jgi:hypothetical protein